MTNVTELASGRITNADTVTIELVEADETPAVIIGWPAKPTLLHPRRFPGAAAAIARLFAAASTELAGVKSRRQL